MTWAKSEHDEHARQWRALWERLAPVRRQVDEWQTPWLDESWKDGNPMFSAWSPKVRRGIRILQHPDTKGFVVWRDRFGEGSQRVDEVVISCERNPESMSKVARLIESWLHHADATVVSEGRGAAPHLAA